MTQQQQYIWGAQSFSPLVDGQLMAELDENFIVLIPQGKKERNTLKDQEAWRAAVHGITASDMTEQLN